jgi:hypothetical protein
MGFFSGGPFPIAHPDRFGNHRLDSRSASPYLTISPLSDRFPSVFPPAPPA